MYALWLLERIILVAFILMLIIFLCGADVRGDVEVVKKNPGYAEPVVLVECGNATGSGVVVHRDDNEYVWTAAHVVAGAEQLSKEVSPGTDRIGFRVHYKDVKVVRSVYCQGRKVGEDFRWAEVLRYSDMDTGYDLALLRSRAPVASSGASFAFKTPAVGQEVYHVGSPMGRPGYNSLILGHVSAVNRLSFGLNREEDDPRNFHMDQYNLAITGGSSGGPVFCSRSFEVCGLLTQGAMANNTITWCVPSRIIRQFARESGCLWAVDEKVPVPPLSKQRRRCPRTTPLPVH